MYSVARLANNIYMEFYDLTLHDVRPVSGQELHGVQVLFKVAVHNKALKSGEWPVVGKLPLTAEEETAKDVFFMQDSLSNEVFKYVYNPLTRRASQFPATAEDVRALEAVAVWDSSHIEERLRDHYAGRPNKWTEHFRAK
nr:Imm26 family immunity protein [Amycolatopsis sp. CA-230715]